MMKIYNDTIVAFNQRGKRKGDEMLDIHIPSDRISKYLTRAIEDAIALAAISQKEQELENAANFDWSIGHVSHYYI